MSSRRKIVELSTSTSLCYTGDAILILLTEGISQKRICSLVSLLRGVSCCGAGQLFTAMKSKGILQGLRSASMVNSGDYGTESLAKHQR